MSISTTPFGSTGLFPTFSLGVPITTQTTSVHILQCTQCGFEPDSGVVAPRVCPKCMSQSFERVTRPGSLLANAERY